MVRLSGDLFYIQNILDLKHFIVKEQALISYCVGKNYALSDVIKVVSQVLMNWEHIYVFPSQDIHSMISQADHFLVTKSSC